MSEYDAIRRGFKTFPHHEAFGLKLERDPAGNGRVFFVGVAGDLGIAPTECHGYFLPLYSLRKREYNGGKG